MPCENNSNHLLVNQSAKRAFLAFIVFYFFTKVVKEDSAQNGINNFLTVILCMDGSWVVVLNQKSVNYWLP